MSTIVFPDTITVTVTADDIAKGEPEECGSCPIAIAAMQIDGVVEAAVYPQRMTIWSADRMAREYHLPDDAQIFVAAFDLNLDVEPFTFEAVAA